MSVKLLQSAMLHLASVCDSATSHDGQGFNKLDSELGKSLAVQENWTNKQTDTAINILKKYKKQLKNAGFDLDKIFNESETEKNKTINPTPIIKTSKNTAKLVKAPDETYHIEVRFQFDWDILELVKSLPGRKFHDNSRGKYWTVAYSTENVEKLQKAEFQVCENLLKNHHIEEKPNNIIEEIINVPGLKKELFPFQKQGVSFIEHKKGRVLIADEMGLGKTIQALAWLTLHPEKRPAIILCPAHLKLNWVREIKNTMPENQQKFQMLQGTSPYKITSDIIIINYDILSDWVEELQKINPQVLIADEFHYIKNSSAIRTKATKQLAKKIPHVIGLTGTPIVNRPIEAFNIIQIINKSTFPDFWGYAHRYCGAVHNGFGWDFSGASNKEELHRKLTETIMIRRKKADVLKELPDKVYSYIPIELKNKEEYERAENEFINYIRETKGRDAAKKAQQAEHLVRIELLKQLSIKGKIEQAIQWIQNFIDSGNGDGKLVVFAVHKEAINKLMTMFKSIAVKVDGSVSIEKRNEAVQAFQNDPTVKLFVGNIQAAGTGLTLTAASSVAFLELPWTPGEIVQAEDRCHRIGQKNTVNVYYLLADKTIEMDIAGLLDEKRKILSAVLDGKEAEETKLLTELIKKYEDKRR